MIFSTYYTLDKQFIMFKRYHFKTKNSIYIIIHNPNNMIYYLN